jgi:hypothetical protein
MSNILLNKPATANDYYAPFTPAKAVDGVISTLSRWVSSKTSSTTPSWLQIDLQGAYCVNQYILAFMGSSTLWNSTQYNVKTFKVQGSMDGGSFFDLDSVSNNTSPNVNKSLTPTWVRYLRVYITSGLNCNNGVSSVVDFQAFEPANVPMLSNLVPSAGTLSPVFGSRTFNYSMNVDNGVGTIAFTPTALQTNMEIKVNGTVVASGTQSGQITLDIGNNNIPITVKSSDGLITTNYSINVTRAGLPSLLSSLNIKDDSDDPVAYTPTLSNTVFNYTASVSKFVASVIVTPLSVDSSATVKVNGIVVPRNQSSSPITMNTGTNTITILVNSTSYSIVITKLS